MVTLTTVGPDRRSETVNAKGLFGVLENAIFHEENVFGDNVARCCIHLKTMVIGAERTNDAYTP